jgi:hypothetical protein
MSLAADSISNIIRAQKPERKMTRGTSARPDIRTGILECEETKDSNREINDTK